MVPQDIHYSCWYVSNLGHSLLTTRQRDGQSPSEIGSAEKDIGGQRHHAFMVCHASCGSSGLEPYSSIGSARQCGCTILWLNPTATQWIRSYMLTCSWVHDPMIAGQPIFFLPWMVGHQAQSYTFKQKLHYCESFDLSRFVVDLRERHLEY